jgi:flagellar protein FlaG
MNEISLQPALNAKTSAPGQNVNETHAKTKSPNLVEVSQAEAQQIDKAQSNSAKEAQDQPEQAQQDRLNRAVAQLNDYVQNTERKLEFQVDDDSGQTVVRVYDKVSEELIRQIPNEEALTLAERLSQEEPLMLFSAQV